MTGLGNMRVGTRVRVVRTVFDWETGLVGATGTILQKCSDDQPMAYVRLDDACRAVATHGFFLPTELEELAVSDVDDNVAVG
jgi:hypothetical protein